MNNESVRQSVKCKLVEGNKLTNTRKNIVSSVLEMNN